MSVAHSLFLFTYITPYVGMAIIGIAWSQFGSTIYTCIPKLVKPMQLGTGIGMILVSNNLSYLIYPIIVSQIRINYGFFATISFYLVNSLVSVVFSMLLLEALA